MNHGIVPALVLSSALLPGCAPYTGELLGHKGFVHSIAFSPDGRLLATGGGGAPNYGDIRIWDADSGSELVVLPGHKSSVVGLSFLPGNLLVSGGWDQKVRVWDLDSGNDDPVRVLDTGHQHRLDDIAISPDRSVVATAGGAVFLWDISTGTRIGSLPSQQLGVASLVFHPGGTSLATGSGAGVITLWSIAVKAELVRFTADDAESDESSVWSLAFRPDGNVLASGSGSGILRLWNAQTGGLLGMQHAHESTDASLGKDIWGIAFSPDGRLLASVGHDGVKLWDGDSAAAVGTLIEKDHPYAALHSLSFSPDGTRLVVGSDQTVSIFDVRDWTER